MTKHKPREDRAQSNNDQAQLVRKLQTIQQVAATIASEKDLDKILQQTCQAAYELFDVDHSGLVLRKPGAPTGVVAAEYPDFKTKGKEIQIEGITLEEELFNEQKPVWLADVTTRPDLGPVLEVFQEFDINSILMVPMVVQDRMLGSFSLDAINRRRDFTVEEVDLCRLFADQVAVAVENARLIAEAGERVRQLEQISQASKEIMSRLGHLQLDDMLQLIVRHAAEILEAESCSILLVKQPGVLSLEAGQGYAPGMFVKGMEIPIRSGRRSGLIGHIAHEGVLFNVQGNELTEHQAIKWEGPHPLPSQAMYSLLAMPLWSSQSGERRLVGLLRADNKKNKSGLPDPDLGFSTIDEWLIGVLSDVIVVAIQGADLFDRLRTEKDLSTRLIASTPDGVVAIDSHGRISEYNPQAEAILGYGRDEVIGRRVDMLYVEPDEPRRIGEQLRASPEGKLPSYETYVKSKWGERIPILLSATWLLDAAGNEVGSVGYFEDLRVLKDMRRRVELLLEASNVVARAQSLDAGLDHLAGMLVEQMRVSFCRIYLLDADEQLLLCRAVYDSAAGTERTTQAPESAETVLMTEWPLLDSFLANSGSLLVGLEKMPEQAPLQEWRRCLNLPSSVQSLFLIPLRLRDHPVGLLCLGDPRSWSTVGLSEEQTGLATAVAEQTAVLINQVQLLEQTERHRQLLLALDEASRSIRAEKETDKLLQEVVRLAGELVGYKVGGLFLNDSYLGELELHVAVGLPQEWVRWRLPLGNDIFSQVTRTGHLHQEHDYPFRVGNDEEVTTFDSLVALPLRLAGDVEAVLFIASIGEDGRRPLLKVDLETLQRFAVQASLALRTSRLMNKEQRMFRQLNILHKISDFIQSARDLDKTFYVVLTGITAGYGLGFNRAALLLLDEVGNCLEGHSAIGHLDEAEARHAWQQSHRDGLYDIGHFLDRLDQGVLETTPLHTRIQGLQLMLGSKIGAFERALSEGRCLLLSGAALSSLPVRFKEAFEPAQPFVVVPMMAHGRPIGLLVADNKFTRAPITDEDVEALFTFANTAAIAIDNARLFEEAKASREHLRAYFAAGNALVSQREPLQVLQDVVEQARIAAGALFVSVVMFDETGQAQQPACSGLSFSDDFDIRKILRPNGISAQVMRRGTPVAIHNTRQEHARVNPALFNYGVCAALCLPISIRGKRIGVMWVHYDRPRRITTAEIEAIQFYVNQSALAYDNAQRLEEAERMRQAADALAGAAGLTEVLTTIVESARNVLRADSTAVWSYDNVRKKFILEESIAVGIPKGLWDEFRRAEPQPGQTAFTVMERGRVAVGDVTNHTQYPFLGPATRRLLTEVGARSFMAIALTAGEEKLGVLYVNYNRERTFSEEEQRVVQALANHAALALKKARLLKQLEKTRNTARVVAKVTTSKDLDETLSSVVRGTQDALSCDAVTLYVYDPGRKKLRYPPTVVGVWDEAGVQKLPVVPENSIVMEMLRRGEVYIVDNVANDPLFTERRFTREEKIVSLVAVPLRIDENCVGVMFINYRTEYRFTGDDLENIELFANQAAVAIHDAQLYEQAQTRADELQIVYEAVKTVTGSLDLEQILAVVAEQVWELMGRDGQKARYCSVSLVSGHWLKPAAVYPPELMLDFQRLVGDRDLRDRRKSGITGRAVRTDRTQLIGDVTRARAYIPFGPSEGSELAVPLKMDGKVIGVINVEHPQINAFRARDLRTIELLAAQAASAIHKADQFERLEQTYKELKQARGRVDSMIAITWQSIVASTWQHSVGNPVDTLRRFLMLIKDELPRSRHSTKNNEKWQMIYGYLAEMEHVLADVEEPPIFSEFAGDDVESLDLNDLVDAYCRQHAAKRNCSERVAYEQIYELSPEVTVRASREWLCRVIGIVIDNAVNAMQHVEVKKLVITTRQLGTNALILIQDTGKGISPELLTLLFERPVPKQKGEKGSGVGLMLARFLLQAYGGNIQIESTGQAGTTVTISLPVEL